METLTFRYPRLVALIILVLVAGGLSSLMALGRQEDPTITNLFATATTVFPGAEPERVETLVTAKIEDVLRELSEVDVIESTSATGISIVSIELTDTLPDNQIEQVWSEIRDALSDAQVEFPAGAGTPELETDGAGAYGAIAALSARHDNVSTAVMGRYATDFADRLRNVPGTKLVDLFGAPEEEVLVTIDPQRSAALGLTARDISRAIQSADAKGQAGRLRATGNDLVINLTGEIDALDRLRNVVVRESANGTITWLGDIAEVSRGVRTPAAELAIHDGRRAILIAAKLEDGLQVDRWMTMIREEVAAYQDKVPASLSLDLSFDQSTYTSDRLLEVATNMAIGVALVVGVLFITLGARAALIVALILPIVSLASLLTMNFLGLAIHQMSVTGLIVALGLLVDAGIVMTDEVAKRVRRGETRINAAGAATRRLFAPLLASTLTTALSFTPMILLPGPAGDFVGSIAIAVVVMLLWSFAVAVTVTPALAAWTMPDGQTRSWFANGVPGGPIAWLFERSLCWAVANPLRSVALSLILPILGFVSMPTLTAQFFPGVDRDQFHIEVELGPAAAITKTGETVAVLDAVLRDHDEIESVSWVIGRSAPGFYYNIVGNRDNAPQYAQALVTTASPEATETILPELQRSLSALAPEAQVLVRGLVQGPPVAAPVELRLVGPDLDTLSDLGDELRAMLADVPTVTTTRATINAVPPKVSIAVDEARARLLGLDLAAITGQMQAGLEGATGGSLVEGTDELPVRVRLGDAERGDLNAIADLPIIVPNAAALSAQGTFPALPLSAIADIEIVPSNSSITRRNAERVNTVQAFILRGVLPEEALAETQALLAETGFAPPPGYRLEFGGDSDARADTLGNLLASVGLIVLLTIAVIVLTFNSFRLSAIAFIVCGLSAGLSILALAIFQYPFGINAIIGVIGSIGVSINAAIIIMTGLQADDHASAGDEAAMVEVLMGSSRHIVSTTITTFGGFLPLILAGGGFWPPFAMSVAGGVLLSTIVSFYFTPPMFKLIYAAKGRSQRSAIDVDSLDAGRRELNDGAVQPLRLAAE
ncbi:MAG: efflux RND transporter permease subunit [Roseitalea sp.]|jgi:multidrug efflux pump subunit AcrB|nr:efflux RND transporter permease subunit [Roseitalea sp.]MBO6721656.1 efflux RND transporter permease subunit [Roseitalea sp.]MBO6743556.1 efflux RND transporter permease subunit [Roseitalea sp.]